MTVHSFERAFLALSGSLLLACLGALLYASTTRQIHLPGHAGTVDPAQVMVTPPFDQPGVREVGPNQYEVVVIARTWNFLPNEIRVPVGAEITFIVTSIDVIHGFEVARTRINAMVIPGQITRLRYRFRERGEYLLICHEYCGVGHHTMGGKVVVE
jgi:cytochrome c oxidase subunit II